MHVVMGRGGEKGKRGRGLRNGIKGERRGVCVGACGYGMRRGEKRLK